MLCKIKHGIQNLIKWFPVVWKDRDWDQHFIYKILHFKLSRMEKYQREYGMSTISNDIADQIKLCVNLLDRITKHDYIDNAFLFHNRKWGELNLDFKQNGLFYNVEKANTEEEKKIENKARMRLYKHVDYLEEQDKDMLFNNMKKYINGWWD